VSDLPAMLTPREAAQVLRHSPDTIIGWCRRGLLRYFKTPGGRWLIPSDSIADFLGDKPTRRTSADDRQLQDRARLEAEQARFARGWTRPGAGDPHGPGRNVAR